MTALLAAERDLDGLVGHHDHPSGQQELGRLDRNHADQLVLGPLAVGDAAHEPRKPRHEDAAIGFPDALVEGDVDGLSTEEACEAGHGAIVEVIAAARALAWWPHSNMRSPELYRARQASFARLRKALSEPVVPETIEEAAVVRCARVLAGCSDSNRWGLPYYERKAAFAQLRGALAGYDGPVPA